MTHSDSRRDVIRLSPEWLSLLGPEFSKPYMTGLRAFLKVEKAAGKVIYPPDMSFLLRWTQPPPLRCVLW